MQKYLSTIRPPTPPRRARRNRANRTEPTDSANSTDPTDSSNFNTTPLTTQVQPVIRTSRVIFYFSYMRQVQVGRLRVSERYVMDILEVTAEFQGDTRQYFQFRETPFTSWARRMVRERLAARATRE